MAATNSTRCAAALTQKQIVRTVDKLAALKAQIAIYDPTRKTKPSIARSIEGRGKYFAIGGRVTAFVMLDEDTMPQEQAANDGK